MESWLLDRLWQSADTVRSGRVREVSSRGIIDSVSNMPLQENRGAQELLCLLLLALGLSQCSCWREIQKVDTHCHYVPAFYYDLLKEHNVTAGGYPIPDWDAASHLQLMDTINVSVAVVSVTTPGAVIKKDFPVEESRKLARQLNEYGYNLTQHYPGRFRFLATLTLPDVQGSVDEAIYALDNLGAGGVILMATSWGVILGSELFDPLYAVLDDRKAVVLVHPAGALCNEFEDSSSSGGPPPWALDFLLDTTRAAFSLLQRQVTMRYPNIKFILSHSGGFLPFAAIRTSNIVARMTSQTRESVVSQLQRFYVDIAISANDYSLPSTLAIFQPSQVSFGSDYPFVGSDWLIRNAMVDMQAYFESHLDMKTQEQIYFKTGSHLFPPLVTAGSSDINSLDALSSAEIYRLTEKIL